MFPEYRDLITRLKTEDAHFTRLFDAHNELDQRIKNMEAHIEPGTPEDKLYTDFLPPRDWLAS